MTMTDPRPIGKPKPQKPVPCQKLNIDIKCRDDEYKAE